MVPRTTVLVCSVWFSLPPTTNTWFDDRCTVVQAKRGSGRLPREAQELVLGEKMWNFCEALPALNSYPPTARRLPLRLAAADPSNGGSGRVFQTVMGLVNLQVTFFRADMHLAGWWADEIVFWTRAVRGVCRTWQPLKFPPSRYQVSSMMTEAISAQGTGKRSAVYHLSVMLLYTSTVAQRTEKPGSLTPVAPPLATMADWVVATEAQYLAVGMGVMNSSHIWDSSSKWYTLPVTPLYGIQPPTVMRSPSNWAMAKKITLRGGRQLHSSLDGSYWKTWLRNSSGLYMVLPPPT